MARRQAGNYDPRPPCCRANDRQRHEQVAWAPPRSNSMGMRSTLDTRHFARPDYRLHVAAQWRRRQFARLRPTMVPINAPNGSSAFLGSRQLDGVPTLYVAMTSIA